jgi:hypothetical protein
MPLRFGDAVEACLDLQRLDRREEGVEQDFLVDDADRRLGVARMRVDVEAPDLGAALGLVHQAGEDVDERRFPCAIGAEQAEDLAAGHVEADPVERALAALIGLAEVLDADRGLGHGAGHTLVAAGCNPFRWVDPLPSSSFPRRRESRRANGAALSLRFGGYGFPPPRE